MEGVSCNDGNGCTTNDTCSISEFNQKSCLGTPVAVDDNNVCTDDACVDGTVLHTPVNGVPCTAKDACSPEGLCDAGVCVASGSCPCTTDAECMAGKDACDGMWSCDKTGATNACVQQPGTAVVCDASTNPCQLTACNPETAGCETSAMPNGTACSDDNECTTADSCQAGACAAGAGKSCDDDNICTDDSCDPATGECTFSPNAAPCDDNNNCTVGDACAGGSCAAGTGPDCDDQNPCTADSCSGGQCQHTAMAGPCDDGNPCTSGTQCTGGACGCPGAAPETTKLTFSVEDFDVADDGSLVAVGRSGKQIWAACYAPGMALKKAGFMVHDNGEAAVARVHVSMADVSHHFVVMARMHQVPDDNITNSVAMRMYGPDCEPITDLIWMLEESGDEYFDLELTDDGHGALVYKGKVGDTNGRWMRYIDPTGAAVGTPLKWEGPNCNNGIHVAVNKKSGGGVATCTSHQSTPVYYQRFSAEPAWLDASAVPVAGSEGGASSWYDSHIVGVNDDSRFMVLWTDYKNMKQHANFYGPDGALGAQIDVADTQKALFDTYRSRNVKVQTPGGDFVVPYPVANSSTHEFLDRYTATGALVQSVTDGAVDHALFVMDSNGNTYVKDKKQGSTILVNGVAIGAGDCAAMGNCPEVQEAGQCAVNCDDGQLCTADSCDPAQGCLNQPEADCGCLSNPGSCDDGVACTTDMCTASGACAHLGGEAISMGVCAESVVSAPTVCSPQALAVSTDGMDSQAFGGTGGTQSFMVPAGVTAILVKIWGAGGGAPETAAPSAGGLGGGGGFTTAMLPVTPGETLEVIVGKGGTQSDAYGGGGQAGLYGAGGGGRSAIRRASTELATAGGGGGGSNCNSNPGDPCGDGGAGGWPGQDGGASTPTDSSWGYPGMGGTHLCGGHGGATTCSGCTWQSGSGAGGAPFAGGTTVKAASGQGSGGGGGGYHGGGAGGGDCGGNTGGGGGGGSCWVSPMMGCVLSGVGPAPANMTDPDYVMGVGLGGPKGKAGGDGRIVIWF